MTTPNDELFWKLFARLPYVLLILALLCLSVLTILRSAMLCDVRTTGLQVIVSTSFTFYLGVFMLAFTVALAGWLLRKVGVENCEKLIILGLLIPAVPLMLDRERVVVHPDYVVIEQGTRFSPEVRRIDIQDTKGISVVYRKAAEQGGGYVFSWKSRTGKGGSVPMSPRMTAALPAILTVMGLHDVPYLGN